MADEVRHLELNNIYSNFKDIVTYIKKVYVVMHFLHIHMEKQNLGEKLKFQFHFTMLFLCKTIRTA